MENNTLEGAPLTRRQAREIERRTGVRPTATAAKPATEFRSEDTGRIERNEITALVSVLPTELVQQLAVPAVSRIQSADAGRSLTVRAPMPPALLAQRRRRAAGGFAAAASVTALAAVGLTSLTTGHGAPVADSQHQANLLAATNADKTQASAPAQTAADAQATQAAQAAQQQVTQAPAAESTEATSVAHFDAAAVSDAVVVEQQPVAAVAADGTTVSIPHTGQIQQDIIAYASSMLGSYGMDCTDYVQNALAHAGLVTPRLEGGPDLGVESFLSFGTVIPASEAQPGDLLLKFGYHVGIYAGNGQAYQGGWNGAADDNVLTSYQADPYFYDAVVRVTG